MFAEILAKKYVLLVQKFWGGKIVQSVRGTVRP